MWASSLSKKLPMFPHRFKLYFTSVFLYFGFLGLTRQCISICFMPEQWFYNPAVLFFKFTIVCNKIYICLLLYSIDKTNISEIAFHFHFRSHVRSAQRPAGRGRSPVRPDPRDGRHQLGLRPHRSRSGKLGSFIIYRQIYFNLPELTFEVC